MKRRLLVIAYHFPPLQESSGIHRTLAFSRYLAAHDWSVTVLTASLRAYDIIREENERLIPEGVEVHRAFALDARRHLSIAGRYPGWLALPDRWQSWILGGFVKGMSLIRRLRPDAIFSTYPIASAHAIAYLLQRCSGLPWVADFRDPMAQDNFPPDPLARRAYWWLDRRVAANASALLFSTPSAAQTCRRRYPELPAERVHLVENGFDEWLFPAPASPPKRHLAGPRILLHSGLMYSAGRDPECLFKALVALKSRGILRGEDWQVVLRAPGDVDRCRASVERLGVGDVVQVKPPLPYDKALEEILAADALLVVQARDCNQQIPAKLYEYLYARRPIVGLADPQGDTARLLVQMGFECIAALEDERAIEEAFEQHLPAIAAEQVTLPTMESVAALSRRARTAELAAVLNDVCGA